MDINEINDLSEICRLCLNTPNVLIPFETTSLTSNQTIHELIKFCLDINCSISDDSIFPKNVCEMCLEKLEVAFELKKNAQESDKYLKQILLNSDEVEDQEEEDLLQPLGDYYENEPKTSFNASDLENLKKGQRCGEFSCSICSKTFKYVKSFNNHLKSHKFTQRNSNDEASEPRSEPDEEVSDIDQEKNDPEYISIGERSGDYVCSSCGRAFKYIKPYKNHLKMHKLPADSKTKRYLAIKKQSIAPSSSQAPYDSISPYGSPATSRKSSPDMSTMMIESNFHSNLVSPPTKRSRKQKLPSRSPSLEPYPEIIVTEKRTRSKKLLDGDEESSKNAKLSQSPSIPEPNHGSTGEKRSRGRPRKTEGNDQAGHELGVFSEVDVSIIQKAKPISILADESSSSKNSHVNRSRSPSVEVVQEFDIFGSVIATNDALSSEPNLTSRSANFACDIFMCDKKFHLKANLKKHKREQHGTK